MKRFAVVAIAAGLLLAAGAAQAGYCVTKCKVTKCKVVCYQPCYTYCYTPCYSPCYVPRYTTYCSAPVWSWCW